DLRPVTGEQAHRHDERGDAERDPAVREKRNRRDELRGARAQVAERHLEGEGHYRLPISTFSIAWTKGSNSTLASCGPGEASGWNCTARIGSVRCRNPS